MLKFFRTVSAKTTNPSQGLQEWNIEGLTYKQMKKKGRHEGDVDKHEPNYNCWLWTMS